MKRPVRVRKSAKPRLCDVCRGRISPGDLYATHTMFPSDEDYYWADRDTLRPSRSPVRLNECGECYERRTDGPIRKPEGA